MKHGNGCSFYAAIALALTVGLSACSTPASAPDAGDTAVSGGDQASEVETDESSDQVADGRTQPPVAPLDEYVATPDDSFLCADDPEELFESDQATVSIFRMYSLTWRDENEVDRPQWDHWLSIFQPKDAHPTRAMLFIGGGSNRDDPPKVDDTVLLLATLAGSVVAVVEQIPNERLKFADETDERYIEDGRTEDELIAYAWDKYLTTADPTWLPRLPMTKAVMRAMDVVQREHPGIEEFLVVGASKRGWTTWTVAAVDPRVVAIVPAVIDVLNVVKSLDNHHAAYGFWAPATHDYEDMGVLDRLHTPEFANLCGIVDPYSYLDRYTMPKFLINSTGDQFFTPDSWRFYFDDLPGEKYLRYMPNTDHDLNADAYLSLASFHAALLKDAPRPVFDWHMEPDGTLVVECETEPTKVLLWQATNPSARDFRLEEIGPVFESSVLASEGDGVYRTNVPLPAQGWTAFLVELHFPNPAFSSPFIFSTGVSIVPDTLPYGE